jgi:subtilase family serine protease
MSRVGRGDDDREVAWRWHRRQPVVHFEGAATAAAGMLDEQRRVPWQGVATQCNNRAEPDLSLNAAVGQNIFWNGGLTPSGGTSIVAPELAGIFAQINAYLQALGNVCGSGSPCPTIGDPHWDLYDANAGSPHHPYYDITSGCTSNDIGGGFCAGTGYDLATGLGAANMLQLAWSVLWFSVAELTPPTVFISGPSTGAWHNAGTLSWTVADTGGSFPATGVAGYSYR